MAFDDAVRALDAERGGLSTQEMHELLLHLADVAGFLPQQVVGPSLRVRWYSPGDAERPGGRVLQLACAWEASGDAVAWSARPAVLDAAQLEEGEHLTLKYADDPDLASELPYLWNLRVNGLDHGQWANDFISGIYDWDTVEWAVGEALARLPLELAALPAEWYDGTFTALDEPLHLWSATASRRGLDLHQCRSIPDPADPTSRTSEECDYHLSPLDAAESGARSTQLLMTHLSPDFPISGIGISGGLRDEPFSGFMTPDRQSDADAPDPRRVLLGTKPPDPHDWLRERERASEPEAQGSGRGPAPTGTAQSVPSESLSQQDFSPAGTAPGGPQPAPTTGEQVRRPWWKLW